MIVAAGNRQKKAQGERGAALVLVLMLSAVFLLLMGSLIDVLAIESQNAIESADSDAALTAAYSGVDALILAMEEYYQNSVQNGQFPTSATCAFSRPGGGTITTTCNATLMKTWNTSGQNYYLIESTGHATPSTAQEIDRTVDALVKEIPFGAYSQFTVTETSNTGGPVWYSSGQYFNGPVYSGGPMHIRYDSGAQKPIFPDGFTTTGSPGQIHWYDIVDGDNSGPNTPSEVQSVYGTSSPSFIQGTLSLPALAQNLVVFSEAYYGDAQHADPSLLPGSSVPNGVYVDGNSNCQAPTLCTGIFVQGDVTITSSSVASPNGDLSSGSETWNFDLGNNNTAQVTVDFGSHTTTVTSGGSTTTYNGVLSGEPGNGNLGNGAIFVNGSVTIKDGSSVHGQYTLAVPDPPQQNTEKMTLQGSLTYSSDPTKGPSEDELALWADKIMLDAGGSAVSIDGMLLTGYANECSNSPKCGGYFANIHCNAAGCSGGGTGTLTLDGSIIENMRGKLGVVDAGGNPIGGYLRNLKYDARLGAFPPPFSPTTNLYSIVALSDRGTFFKGSTP